ncbi:MAG TPA: NUDIX hydrolase [Candidatus Saccharimonadales bacterium]
MQDVPCTYRISVKAVIKDDDGRILLGRESDGSWELPGGGLEHGEAPKAALRREITEETGFILDWISERPVAFWTINKEVGSPAVKWFSFVAYEARVSGDFKASFGTNDEVEEIRYVSRKEALALKLHDNTRPYFVQNC